MKHFSALLRSSLATRLTLLDQAWVSGCNFLVGVLLTRWAGLEGYGYFALAWLGLLFCSNLQQAYLLKAMMSLGPRQFASCNTTYWAHTQLMQAGLCLLLGMSLGSLVYLSDHLLPAWSMASLFPILPLATMGFLNQEYYRRYFFIQQRVGAALLADFLAYGGWLVGLCLYHWLGSLGVAEAFTAMGISFWLATAWAAWHASIPWRVKPEAVLSSLRSHGRFGSWLLGTAVFQFFSGNYLQVVAASLLGHAALGALRIAQSLMGICHVLFLAMENRAPLQASKALHRDGIKGMLTYLKILSKRTGTLLLILLAGIAATSAPLLGVVYGHSYASYAYLVAAYCGLYLLIFPAYPLRYALRSLARTWPIFLAYVLSAGFCWIIADPLIRHWGLVGVVGGLMASQLLMQLCYGIGLYICLRQDALSLIRR